MSKGDPLSRSFLVGILGGIAGLTAMGWAMKASQRLLPSAGDQEEQAGDPVRTAGPTKDGESMSLVGKHYRDGEPATGALGRLVYEKAAGHEPAEKTEERLSTAVHWTYGLSVASLYAMTRPPRMPGWQSGLAYGIGLWALGDELAVPLLGLAKGPQAVPLKTHASALLAHLAFGLAAGVTMDVLEERLAR